MLSHLLKLWEKWWGDFARGRLAECGDRAKLSITTNTFQKKLNVLFNPTNYSSRNNLNIFDYEFDHFFLFFTKNDREIDDQKDLKVREIWWRYV